MKRTLPRRLAAVAAVAAVPLVSSCATNFNAQTDQIYTPADGMNAQSGTVEVLNALIVSDEPGSGRLIAGLVNNDQQRADALTQVAGAEESSGVQFTISGGDSAIPPGGALQLADPDAAFVAVSGDPKEVAPGTFVRVTFSFKNGEPHTLNVPVLSPDDEYSDVPLSPAAGSATPSGSVSPSSTASPSGSPSSATSPSPKG